MTSQAIPDAAVAAAAQTFPGYTPEHEADDLEREINAICRSTARRVLEAAAPHLFAPVLALADEADNRPGSMYGKVGVSND